MNREQAQHILYAYVEMECAGGDNKARQSLREVILDAMTEYRSKPSSNWSEIGITYPSIGKPLVTYTGYPKNWDGSPKVTCTGIDPLFKQQTMEVSE